MFSAQLKRFTYVYGAFILCYLVIGACLAVFLSYRSSRPIMRILGTVMGYMPQERLPPAAFAAPERVSVSEQLRARRAEPV